MALLQLITLVVLALALSKIELAVCSVVKGSVLCTDCGSHYDFSGVQVLAKCDKVKNLSVAFTDERGAFVSNLPQNDPMSRASGLPNCLAKLGGASRQLYSLKQNKVSKIVMAKGDMNTYSLLTPLVFSLSCHGKCGSVKVGSSKTIDLNFPPGYGLPPASLYAPFFPIIGIP